VPMLRNVELMGRGVIWIQWRGFKIFYCQPHIKAMMTFGHGVNTEIV